MSSSPYQNAASPPAQSPYAPPPAKRQRLSPEPRPAQNGAMSYTSTSQAASHARSYGNPYAQSPAPSPYSPVSFTPPPQSSFNTPQPSQTPHVSWQQQPTTPAPVAGRHGSPLSAQMHSSQMMPPPPRPNREDKEDRNLSADDIGDSLFGSGINLKDEENYMHSTFNNRHANDSFTTTQSTSFGSSTLSPTSSFNLLPRTASFSSQVPDGAFAGTMGPPRSQEEIENEHRRKRQQAATARNEKLQQHLNNQFLNGNCVRRRMENRAREDGVQLPTQGLYVRNNEPAPEARTMTNQENGEGVVVIRPESMVEQGSQLDHLLSLVSLAASERLRGLVDEAFALARARRYGDHGRVPPEFADIARGEGKQVDEAVVPQSITGTQWDKVPSQEDGDEPNGAPNNESATPQPLPTISFQGRINAQLRALAARDKRAELERIKKREARRKHAENAANSEDPTAAETFTPEAEVPKMTKKEQQKQAKAANPANEAQSHTTTNQTAAMMVLGKKANKYSWMSGGVASMPTNRFAKAGSGTATPTAPGGTPASGSPGAGLAAATAGPDATHVARAAEWGDFREDGPGGIGIQARDWLLVLERDGREKKALQAAYNKLA